MATGVKTGGRQRGTPNKVNGRLAELVEAEAGAPIPVILTRIGLTALNKGDMQLAVHALSKAASYVYPRVQAVSWRSPAMEGTATVTIIDDIR